MCLRWVKLQTPAWPLQNLSVAKAGQKPQHASLVLFRHRAPKAHASTRAKVQQGRRLSLAMGGASQSIDVSGFSNKMGTSCRTQEATMRAVALMVLLPALHFSESRSVSPSMPKMRAGVLTGPPGTPGAPTRQRVHVVHGVPMLMPPTMPAAIQPQMSSSTDLSVKSVCLEPVRSMASAAWPCCRQALQMWPAPAKRSRKMMLLPALLSSF